MTVFWIVLALVALGFEFLSGTLLAAFVSVAALCTAGLAALGAPLGVQVGSFAVLAVLWPVLLRRPLLHRIAGRGIASRAEALMGATGQVTQPLDPVLGTGRVLINGQDWAARATEALAAGAVVRIVGADGIVLLVAPLDTQPSTFTRT